MVCLYISSGGATNTAVLDLTSTMAETDHVVTPAWDPNDRPIHALCNPT
jgi:hypothetical protein